MRRLFLAAALALVAASVAACGTSPTAVPTSAPIAQATAPAIRASASASVAAPPAFIDGTIQSITAERVTLADGQSFAITARTGYVRQARVQPADLMAGDYLGIKGKRQGDGTLLASVIDIFGQKGAGNQFPLLGGDLMTNATLDKIEGSKLTVSFTGGGAYVTLAPDTQIYRDQAGVAADIAPGSMATIVVSNGAAGAIRIH